MIDSLTISQYAQKNMSEILMTFFEDISHIIATAQSFFSNAKLGSLTNQSIGDSMHLFYAGSKFLKQISKRIEIFRNVVRYGDQVLTVIKRNSLFNPGDLNQEIGDMLSVYASSRKVSIVLENPYQNMRGLYLAYYDLDILRQILLQFVSSMILLAKEESDLELRLLLSDIHPETLLSPEMGHYLSASIRSKMKMIFQVKYYGIRKVDSPKPLDEYYSKILHSKGGSMVSYTRRSITVEELNVPCYAIMFDNVIKTVGYFEISGQMPYTLHERLLFVNNIRFFKVVLVSSKKSLIMDQLKTYLKFWGADISCILAMDKSEITDQLSDIGRICAQQKKDIHKHHVIIIDEYDDFLLLLDHAIFHDIFTSAIIITSMMKYREISSKLYC
jgi:hypothetical protein